jgi:hypothetical protein
LSIFCNTNEFSAKTLSRHSGESRNPEDGRETLDCRVKPGNDEERSDQNRLFAVDSLIKNIQNANKIYRGDMQCVMLFQ